MKSSIISATRFSADDALNVTLQLLRARTSRYAWYGTFIASSAVLVTCMLISQHFYDAISYENMLRAQRENVAVWVLDGMPFLFAIWGQVVSWRTTRDAGSAIRVSTSTLRRSLRKERINMRLRTDFFAKLSHEFRTPLNAILGTADLLSQKKGSRPFADDVGVIRGAAENLLALVNDILDYSAIEAGHIELDRVEFDLRECAGNACALLNPQALAKGLRLELDIDDAVPQFVTGDPGRLRQVLINVVGNAVKFTTEGSVRCHVSHTPVAGKRAHRLTVSVADTGPGMDERTLRRLFQPYQRSSGSERRLEGTGLGLAICHEIVEAMGGDITVTSEPGSGSVFTVNMLFEPQQGISLARIARGIELRGVRALLVESPSEERARFEAQLRTLGLDVRLADDGVEAFKEALLGHVQGRAYELLITDLFTEHLPGVELAQLLKARDETRDICLVATTSSGSRGDGRRVKEAGFAAYLTKPVPPEHLGDLLRATLATLAVAEERRADVNLITRHYIRENVAREVAVLLVEDEPVSLQVAQARLEQLGCRVTAASCASEVISALDGEDFHLVLLDYNLPDGRGDEVVTRVMNRFSQAAPPVVMFSAGLTQAEKQRCLRAGAVGFLEKPASREGLLSVLERYCRLTDDNEAIGSEMLDAPIEVTPALRNVFIRESLTRLAQMEKAIGSTLDREVIQRTAHAMRSSARHVGAVVLAAAFADLENSMEGGSEKSIRKKSAEIMRRWRETLDAMEAVQDLEQTVRLG